MATHRRFLRLGVAAAIPAVALLLAWVAWRGHSDRAGRGREDEPPRDAVERAIERGGTAEFPPPALSPGADSDPEVAKQTPGELSISGTVLEPSGGPAKGAEVFLVGKDGKESLESSLEASARARASAEGTFRFDGVGPGPYRLAARLDGHLPVVSEGIAPEADGDPAPVELRLRAAASIRG